MKPKVYLAGGFRSNWQQNVIDHSENAFIFFNPREHGLEKETSQYTTWDLHHVKQCDILFAYMEANNPSGYGLTLEIGYAKALGKTIILVDEKSSKDKKFKRYFGFIRETSDIVVEALEIGLNILNSFQTQRNHLFFKD